MAVDKSLGINHEGIPPRLMSELHQSVEGAIEANQDNLKAFKVAARHATSSFTNDIQRRGTNLPGDTGQNFGLNNQFGSPFGGNGLGLSPFGNDGGFGYRYRGAGLGAGGGGLFGGYGAQGSLAGLKGSTRVAHYKMGLTVQAYKGFGIIKNVVDLMANFAAEGLTIKHKSKKTEKFYKRWGEHVGIQEIVKKILRYYYKYSNVFIYETPGIIDQETYDKMKRAKAGEMGTVNNFNKLKTISDSNDPNMRRRVDKVIEERRKPEGERLIPWQYTLLNPFQMDLRGNKFFGESKWVFVLDNTTSELIRSGTLSTRKSVVQFLDESKVNLPPEFKKLAGSGDDKDPRVVELDQTRLWTMHYAKDDHEDWADPMIWPIMQDLHFKQKMRAMDISVCNSVINAITIFKLGDWKNGFVPPKEHFRKFAEFLRTPSAAMNLVWNDAVSMESNYPPVEKILSMNKYESVDRDILRGLGVPDTLVGGASNSNFSTGYLGVRTLLERLEEGRNTVIRWLNKQLRLIAATMGHRDIPSIKFGKMSLRDEKAEKMLIIQLLDRNIISIEAVLECFGEDFEIEIERLRDEQKLRDESGLLQKHSPYVDPINEMDAEEQMKKESEFKQTEQKLMMKMKQREQKNSKGPNGRPGNSDGIPQQNKRDTKPKGMASAGELSWMVMYEQQKQYNLDHINNIENIVTEAILTTRGKKYKKSLSKVDREGIEQITFAVASNIDHLIKIDLEIIQDTIKSHPRMNSRAAQIYNKMLSDGMTIKQRKDTMAGAIAIYDMEEDRMEMGV